MKTAKLSILLLVTGGILTSMAQFEFKDNDYFPMKMGGDVVFKYADSEYSLKITDLKEKRLYDDKEYSVRLLQYSWGKNDTAYYRTENQTVYYYDKKSNMESINIPNDINVGVTWTSSDSAWKYEITSINARLTTPVKKYKKLLEIKATQLQNRDQTKHTEYLNYFEKNVGKVASVTNGKLTTYRI